MAAPCALSSVTLTNGWQFKQKDEEAEDAWLDVKKVPTNVHLDLIEHGKYVGVNARSIATYSCPTVSNNWTGFQILSWASTSSKQNGWPTKRGRTKLNYLLYPKQETA